MKETAGKLHRETGKILSSKKQEAKGLATRIEGKVQKKVGDGKR